MGIIDSIFGRGKETEWEPTHRALLKDVTYDEIVSILGRPKKAQGGFVYWRGPMSDLDPDCPEGAQYQISNKDFRGFGSPSKKPSIDRETWFVLTNDANTIRMIADEVGGVARKIEAI